MSSIPLTFSSFPVLLPNPSDGRLAATASRASLLIAKIDDPDVDVDYYEQQLKNMTAEVKGKFTNAAGVASASVAEDLSS